MTVACLLKIVMADSIAFRVKAKFQYFFYDYMMIAEMYAIW